VRGASRPPRAGVLLLVLASPDGPAAVCEATRVVVAIADMFAINSRRGELVALLERFEAQAAREPGCHRFTFAASLGDPDRFVLVSEWISRAALDEHYGSQAFAEFQFGLHGLLDRPSELAVYEAAGAVRPLNTRPMDPRDAD
jgi:quinol monooxygenase YgiN